MLLPQNPNKIDPHWGLHIYFQQMFIFGVIDKFKPGLFQYNDR